MENLINAASGFLGNQAGQKGSGNGGFDLGDLGSLVSAASNHAQQNNNPQDSSMFSQIASHLQTQQQQGNIRPSDDDPSDDQLMQHHDQVVNSDNNVGSGEIGNAAALSAIKSFLGNSGSQQGGGNMQSQLIGMAMSQAAQFFDQKQGQGLAQGSKNDAVQQAGQMAMKLMMKNQLSSMIGGGNSGGLASLASKFL
ncbi:hypothetical protein K437DRAFT_256621 [Tilletiaria anomala UBC 951]|uniref:DUF7721 domain-containing protein n=1 Tax=Tilletiaria anomala (strain ATCC 24038 / CBS 436.72 / UBC 951) TaxID=1037660 RepID=A0A066VYC3_TILAU|nr:uncharacterized protein K437DRAFT_256621 [Tilletiaria anomala UBC 951]KDN45283.1 hypothetical protein K437DRAFT_256621 [Tilletiaria anomala UBC 951]